jgi:hypothetical protein
MRAIQMASVRAGLLLSLVIATLSGVGACGGSTEANGSGGTAASGGTGGSTTTGGTGGSGAASDFSSCGQATDCVIASVGCCGGCEPLSPSVLVSINADQLSAYVEAQGCSGVACSPCPPVDELKTLGQYFVPVCEAGRCGIQDIRQTDLVVCQTDSDCFLRDGAACCDECDGTGLVAVSSTDFGPRCEPFPACPRCASIIPEGYIAVCAAGRCQVRERTP